MKKLIIDVKGKEDKEMNYEEVLKKYKPLMDKCSRSFNFPGYSEDDIRQESQIALWEAFKTYDEENAFVVHAKWCIKDRMANLGRTLTTTQKRGNEYANLLSLDYEDSADENNSLANTLFSDFDIHEDFENKELLHLINSIAKDDLDKVALQVMLGNMKNGQAVEITGASKQLIANRERRLKKKLTECLIEFNPQNRRFL